MNHLGFAKPRPTPIQMQVPAAETSSSEWLKYTLGVFGVFTSQLSKLAKDSKDVSSWFLASSFPSIYRVL